MSTCQLSHLKFERKREPCTNLFYLLLVSFPLKITLLIWNGEGLVFSKIDVLQENKHFKEREREREYITYSVVCMHSQMIATYQTQQGPIREMPALIKQTWVRKQDKWDDASKATLFS